MSNAMYNKRLSVGITEKMDDMLEEIAISRTRKGKPVTKADVIREAVRFYFDHQDDLSGSRKQITKSLEGQIETLTRQVATLLQQNETLHKQLTFQGKYLENLAQALQPVITLASVRTRKGGE